MKKRIVCAILSLILLVSLIPAGALTASAATRTVSEKAITILKQLQGYRSTCSTKGYIGYGTKCTEKGEHGTHKLSEQKVADKALREELKKIDQAVNGLASANGLSLSQSQHDALTLFSYRNGTAWISGTGDVKRAVTTRVTGNEFLNMFLNWQASEEDNNRRKIEANMYLNGVYSTTVPSKYIKVNFKPNGGTLVGNKTTYYYDYTLSETELPTPIREGYTFKGWYNDEAEKDGKVNENPTNWVYELNQASNGQTLTAFWQDVNDKSEDKKFDSTKVHDFGRKEVIYASGLASRVLYLEPNGKVDGTEVRGKVYVTAEYVDNKGVRWLRAVGADEWYYKGKLAGTGDFTDTVTKYWVKSLPSTYANYYISTSKLATTTLYDAPNGKALDMGKVSGDLQVRMEYVDSKGVKWCLIYQAEKYTHTVDKKTVVDENYQFNPEVWVKTKLTVSGGGSNASGLDMDVMVTVTNSYVNSRVNATIHSAKNGSYSQGDKLRIINTADEDGFLWGQVARSEDDATPVGWIALMYTNYSSLAEADSSLSENNSKVIAKARIKLTGNDYVNVRNGAGTDNQIVGALTGDTLVDIYEIKYVNGYQWGRCKQGWFNLNYAEVTRLVDESETGETTQTGYTAYAFTGKIGSTEWIFSSPVEDASLKVDISTLSDSLKKLKDGDSVTITNVTADAAHNTWGKIPQGWIMLFRSDYSQSNIYFDTAKFEVTADSASVRETPSSGANRVDTLSKGTEFDVTKLVATTDTLWGYAIKYSQTIVEEETTINAGWVNLSSRYVKRTNAPITSTEKGPTGLVATVVNAEEVNARAGADIYRNVICKVQMGNTYEVMEGPVNGWYRLKISGHESQDTWVYKQYLDVKSGSGSSSSSSSSSVTVETGKGIVANTYAGVNMRQTAGIGGAFMGKILPGAAVEVLEVTQVGSSKWGRVRVDGKIGWVCMDYITMISYEDIPGYNGGNSGSGSTGGSSSTVTGAQTAIYTGKVKTPSPDPKSRAISEFSQKGDVSEDGRTNGDQKLIVFKTTDINGAVVRILENGDPVTMHELLTVEEETSSWGNSGEYEGDNMGSDTGTSKQTAYWARVNDGYIRAPGDNLDLDPLDEAVYTLVDYDKINVYKNSDLTEKIYGEWAENEDYKGEATQYVKKGNQVTITEVEIHGNVISGKIETEIGEVGWINLSKMTKGAINVKVDNNTNNNNSNNNNNNNNNAPVIGDTGNTGTGGFVNNASGYKYTGKVVNTNEVNVRSTASTGASVTTTLKSGASLVIYETTISENMAWGRCDAGWVYLYYVDLTPASGSAVDARVVYNDNTIAYTDSACSEVAGTYARMSVVDIYEIVGKMARTDLGWVNTDNLL